MSNAPVVSVTDELIAELSAEAAHDDGTQIPVSAVELRALLAEREELKRDAERLAWLIDERCTITEQNGMVSPAVYRVNWPYDGCKQKEWYPSARAAIDAAMKS